MIVGDGQGAAGGRQADPIAQFFGDVVDAWSKGLQAVQALAGLGAVRPDDRVGGAIAGMVEQMRGVAKPLEALLPGAAEFGAAAEAAGAASAQALDLSLALAQAYIAGAGSTLRYCGTLAELFVRYQASLMRAAGDRAAGRSAASPEECRVLADDLRAFLREVGDAAAREARRLEYDLGIVGEVIARATDRATPSPHPEQDRRRHEMKP